MSSEPFTILKAQGLSRPSAACTTRQPVDRGWYLAVEFSEPRARKFNEVLERARQSSQFQALLDESGRVLYRCLIRKEHLPHFMETFGALKGLNCGLRCHLNGHEFPADQISSLLSCAMPRVHAPRCTEFTPPTGSRNLYLGCDRLLCFSISPALPENGKPWWEFSTTGDDLHLRPDHNAMKEYLLGGTFTNALCPMADRRSALAMLDRIPTSIHIVTGLGWRARRVHRLAGAQPALFGGRWPAQFVGPNRPPKFGARLLLRKEGDSLPSLEFSRQKVGHLPPDSPLHSWLAAGESFVGIVLSADRNSFEFALLHEIPPSLCPENAASYTVEALPQDGQLYQKFLHDIFAGNAQ